MHASIIAQVLAFTGIAAAGTIRGNFYEPRASNGTSFTGIASFNNYEAQSNTVCGPKAGVSGTFGAAAGDISPNIGGGVCSGSINTADCDGQQPVSGYTPPSCPTKSCGTCYKVTNTGALGGGSVGGVGNSVIVQIIDVCPSTSAQNYCKTDVPADERCGSSSTNQLDIAESAYESLTGTAFGNGPNLNIDIAPATCPS